MKVKYFTPLLGFLTPTIVLAYGIVLPNSAVAGFNRVSVGFGLTLLGATLACVAGVRTVAHCNECRNYVAAAVARRQPVAERPSLASGSRSLRSTVTFFLPLLGFVAAALTLGYGIVIPHSPIAGINNLTVGYGLTLLGACVAYMLGLWAVVSDTSALAVAPKETSHRKPRLGRSRS